MIKEMYIKQQIKKNELKKYKDTLKSINTLTQDERGRILNIDIGINSDDGVIIGLEISNIRYNHNYFKSDQGFIESNNNILFEFLFQKIESGENDIIKIISNIVEKQNGLYDYIAPFVFTTYRSALIFPIDYTIDNLDDYNQSMKRGEYGLYDFVIMGSFEIEGYTFHLTSAGSLFIENKNKSKQYKYYLD